MTSYNFDYIVVGVGGIGSGTVYWLTRLAPGSKILGLEQFELGHIRGGSQDYSRIIRKFYVDSKFSQLASKSYEPWYELEKDSGLEILFKTGGLMWSPDRPDLIQDYFKAGQKAGSPMQRLNANQIRAKWPQFTIGPSTTGAYDPEAGLVDAAMGNAAHQQCALARGAQIWSNTKVVKIEKLPKGGMKVYTSRGELTCKKVIVTSGAWINQVLSSCGVHIPVKVSQENVSFFATPHLKDYTKRNFPITICVDGDVHAYTLPIHGLPGFKIGLDARGEGVSGDTRTFTPDPVREQIHKDFLNKFLPTAMGRIIETRVCLYTMTYDRSFVIDTLKTRNFPDVIVFCGAGHAYKFSALFGQILSEMAIYGKSSVDISAFCIERPAITDPTFEPEFDQALSKDQQPSKL